MPFASPSPKPGVHLGPLVESLRPAVVLRCGIVDSHLQTGGQCWILLCWVGRLCKRGREGVRVLCLVGRQMSLGSSRTVSH